MSVANKLQPYTSEKLKVVSNRMEGLGLNPQAVRKEISFAVQIVNSDKNLLECSKESVMNAILNVANIGLTLNPAAKECYLISRYDRFQGGKVACLEPSYIGLANLAMKEGVVTQMTTQIVYENDFFEIDLADNVKPVTHKPDMKAKREKMIGCYCLATLASGKRQVEWMSVEELNSIRNHSDSYKAVQSGKIKSCPWTSHATEMYRKTVIKRIVKYLNKSGNQKLDQAIELDNRDYPATIKQQAYIESLLETADIPAKTVVSIEAKREEFSFEQASKCIEYLKDNQMKKHPRTDDNCNSKERADAVMDSVDHPKR